MNILHIGKYYPPYCGGMETYLQDLSEALVKKNHTTTVITHNHQFGLLFSQSSITKQNGLTLIRQRSLKPVLFTPLMLGLNGRINNIFKKDTPDLIHISWPNPSALLLLINSTAKKKPWVLQWHSDMVTERSSFFLKMIYRFIKPLERKLIEQCETVVTSSTAYAKHSPALTNHSHKTEVIPIGINTEKICSANGSNAHAKWPKNHSKVLFNIFSLGRLTFYKNHKLLINALAHEQKWGLVIGGSGDQYSRLNKQVKHLSLENNVLLAGSLSDAEKNNYYKTCDVFCLTSNDRAESYGLVLLEAMYYDCIVVAPDTAGSGMQWLVERYSKGFVFKNNDEISLINTLKHIQTNQAEIDKTPNNFDLDIMQTIKLNERLYEKLINAKGDKHAENTPVK